MIRSALTISSLTLLSRILGYGRDVLLAWVLGAGPVADAFFVALRLPNFFRTLFAEGAFSSAFVPMFSQTLSKDSKEAARIFASRVFTLMALLVLLVVIALEYGMPGVISVMAMGYSEDPSKYQLTIDLALITTPYLLFISLSSLCAGILNSVGRFGIAAAAPSLLNITMIGALLLSQHHAQTAGFNLAYAVTMAGILQFLWLYIHCFQEKLLPTFLDPFGDSQVNTMLKKMIPGVVGAGVMQINILVSTTIASLVPQAVSILSYADRIVQLPLALIGTAIGTALLPTLSKLMKDASTKEEAFRIQEQATDIAMMFTIPAMAGCFMLSYPLMSMLFERGAFTSDVTTACAMALVVMAAGLPAFIMVKIFAPCFYAVGDTKTPFRIAIICLVLNMLLSVMLIGPLSYIGIALANILSSWLNMFLLWRSGHKKGLIRISANTKLRFLGVSGASLIMALTLHTLQEAFASTIYHPAFATKAWGFLGLMAAALFSYFLAGILLHVFNGYSIYKPLRNQK